MNNNNLVTLDDLYKAYLDCRKHKKKKNGTKKFAPFAIYKLQKLRDEINTRKYKIGQSQCFIVNDPRPREVFCANFRDRIIQHFIFNELNPIIDKMLIYDAANCRKTKGTDFAISRVYRFIQSAKLKGNVYFLKFDISGFFMSIDRELLLSKVFNIIDKKYNGKYYDVLQFLVPLSILTDLTKNVYKVSPESMWNSLPKRKTLFGNPNGLPIGNLCSQLYANLYLNDLDHKVKSRHKWYSRYVDDAIIIDNDKNKLNKTLNIVKEELEKVHLTVSERKTYVKDLRDGINYLGVVILADYIHLQQRKLRRIFNTKFNDVKEAYVKISCRLGLMRRYKCWKLFHRLTIPYSLEWDGNKLQKLLA